MLELVSLDSFSMQQLDLVCMCRSPIGSMSQILFLKKKCLSRCLFPKIGLGAVLEPLMAFHSRSTVCSRFTPGRGLEDLEEGVAQCPQDRT